MHEQREVVSVENVDWIVIYGRERVVWDGKTELPEVWPEGTTEFEKFPTEDEAVHRISALMSSLGARATWADVRPTEECAACRADFKTELSHLAIGLECRPAWDEDSDEPFPQKLLDYSCPARFCPDCTKEIEAKLKAME